MLNQRTLRTDTRFPKDADPPTHMATVLLNAPDASIHWPVDLIGKQIPVRLFKEPRVHAGSCYLNGRLALIVEGEVAPQIELTV